MSSYCFLERFVYHNMKRETNFTNKYPSNFLDTLLGVCKRAFFWESAFPVPKETVKVFPTLASVSVCSKQ